MRATLAAPSAPAAPIAPAVDAAMIQRAMLDIVSRVTGYPVEMISLDMDIEADLGIDSIKRVEILSAFEERMPHLPPVSPEMMGSMKTLGQIVGVLAGAAGAVDSPLDRDRMTLFTGLIERRTGPALMVASGEGTK